MIFNAIRESHDLQRDLCRKLTASRRDMTARQLLFLQLKVELMAHAAAEERHLYVPLLMEDGGRLLSATKKKQLAREYTREIVRMRRHYPAEYEIVAIAAASGLVKPSKRAADKPATRGNARTGEPRHNR